MDVNEAIEAYINRFGGYPYFMLMGADDDYVIGLVEESLKTGKEIDLDIDPDALY